MDAPRSQCQRTAPVCGTEQGSASRRSVLASRAWSAWIRPASGTRVRRSALLVLLAALLSLTTVACGIGSSGGDEDKKISVVWNSTPDIAYLPLLMAIDTMKKNGYDIEATTLSGADVAAQALSSDRAQFTSDNVSGAANAIEMGAPIKAVAANSANEAVWVTTDGHQDCASLDGEPVGIFGPEASSGYTKEMNAYFDNECPGVEPKLVTIPDSSLRAQALANGELEATVLALSDAVTLETKLDPDGNYHVTSFRDEFPGLADNYLYTTDQVLADDPDLVNAFVKAELQATREIYSNPERLPQLLEEHFGSKAYSHDVAVAAAKRKAWYANGGLDETGMKGLEKTLKLFDLEGSSDDIVDSDPLDTVLADIGRSDATTR